MKIDLKSALKKRDMSQRSLADAMDVSPGYISDIINGKKLPSMDKLARMLDALDADISEIASNLPAVAVAGKVGAGAIIYLTDDHEKGEGLYHVERPTQLPPHGVVAVEVEGDSMEPVYSEGDLLFYSRVTAEGVPCEAMNRKVIAETEDGRVWVKQIKAGSEPGLFHLLSLNPTGPNMHDMRIKWAAPVRLHLPKEFVKRVD